MALYDVEWDILHSKYTCDHTIVFHLEATANGQRRLVSVPRKCLIEYLHDLWSRLRHEWEGTKTSAVPTGSNPTRPDPPHITLHAMQATMKGNK